MVTFETALDPVTWTEILQGNTYLAFDCVSSKRAEVYLTESATPPAADDKGNPVLSYPTDFDFEANGLDDDVQRIWARGDTLIRGVRG